MKKKQRKGKDMKRGIELIAEERQRQIDVEGYSEQHDSQHKASELIYAAIAYVESSKVGVNCAEMGNIDEHEIMRRKTEMGRYYPFGWSFKPSTDIRDLVKAGALIAAAIDRLLSKLAENEDKTEKQGEQKHIDKIEPKFKIGDWIINPKTGNVLQIKNVLLCGNKGNYEFDYSSMPIESVDKHYHLWTIADAKDGDVLYLQHDGKEHIIIYKGVIKERFRTFVSAYCAYNGIVDAFCFADVSRYVDIAYEGIMPATKEQRDTLMKAMTDAGYAFDFEKKELKKIEDEEYNGEDYGIDSLYHAQRILEKTLGKVDGYQTDDGILEHKCAITAVKKLYEHKPTNWSEEDERVYRGIHNLIYSTPHCNSRKEFSDWLESLKNRIQSKQEWSEENKEIINRAASAIYSLSML